MSYYSRGISCGGPPAKEKNEGMTLVIIGGLFALIFFTPLVKQKR